jgi:hypothetical protein
MGTQGNRERKKDTHTHTHTHMREFCIIHKQGQIYLVQDD